MGTGIKHTHDAIIAPRGDEVRVTGDKPDTADIVAMAVKRVDGAQSQLTDVPHSEHAVVGACNQVVADQRMELGGVGGVGQRL